MTVGKAIIRAGGFSQYANKKKVRVLRKNPATGESEIKSIDVAAIMDPLHERTYQTGLVAFEKPPAPRVNLLGECVGQVTRRRPDPHRITQSQRTAAIGERRENERALGILS